MNEADRRKLSDDELYRLNSIASDGSVDRDALSGEMERRNSLALKAGQRNFMFVSLALVLVGLMQACATYAAAQHAPTASPPNDRYAITSDNGNLCVLDKQTGTVFEKQADGWREHHPQLGGFIFRHSFEATDSDPLGIRDKLKK